MLFNDLMDRYRKIPNSFASLLTQANKPPPSPRSSVNNLKHPHSFWLTLEVNNKITKTLTKFNRKLNMTL